MHRLVAKVPRLEQTHPRQSATQVNFDDLAPRPVVGAEGLPAGQPYASFRGDPWLQETALTRRKPVSSADRKLPALLEACEQLLIHTDCYTLHIGFNTGHVRTQSILHPFGCEIHDIDAITGGGYVGRHFVPVPFDAKIDAIDWMQRRLSEGPMARFRRNTRPQQPARTQPRSWRLGSVDDIGRIVRDLAHLRMATDYYLCSAEISLGHGLVRTTFNCDVTYVVPLRHFREFMAGNFAAAGQ